MWTGQQSKLAASVPCWLTYDLSDSSYHARHAHQSLAVRQDRCVADARAVDAAEERQLDTWRMSGWRQRSHEESSGKMQHLVIIVKCSASRRMQLHEVIFIRNIFRLKIDSANLLASFDLHVPTRYPAPTDC